MIPYFCFFIAPATQVTTKHHTYQRRKPFSWESGRDGGGPAPNPTRQRVEDTVGASRHTAANMRPMSAFSNGGEQFLMNKQWRGAVATADATLIAENARLRAELTSHSDRQVPHLAITQFQIIVLPDKQLTAPLCRSTLHL